MLNENKLIFHDNLYNKPAFTNNLIFTSTHYRIILQHFIISSDFYYYLECIIVTNKS